MMEDSRKRILVATREGIIIFKDVSQPNIFVSFGAKEGLETHRYVPYRKTMTAIYG